MDSITGQLRHVDIDRDRRHGSEKWQLQQQRSSCESLKKIQKLRISMMDGAVGAFFFFLEPAINILMQRHGANAAQLRIWLDPLNATLCPVMLQVFLSLNRNMFCGHFFSSTRWIFRWKLNMSNFYTRLLAWASALDNKNTSFNREHFHLSFLSIEKLFHVRETGVQQQQTSALEANILTKPNSC